MQKRFFLSDVFFDQKEVRIKVIDLENANNLIIKLSDHAQLNSMIDEFISAKDVQAIGYLTTPN